MTGQFLLPFLFAGILCFIAAACSVVVWGMARNPVEGYEHEIVDLFESQLELHHLDVRSEAEREVVHS